jgi:glycerate 2-kinase
VQLRSDALAIWHAAVAAVQSDRLVQDNVRVEGDRLVVGEEELALAGIGRIAVVGAGKAGAGMADGIEMALGSRLLGEKQVTGWVNVPADCVRDLKCVRLHAARPAGVNEPTADGVFGSEKILDLVGSLGPDDVCLCLISGGGSALLPAPEPGISLGDKLQITRQLSAAGANIQQLNTVRKQLSRIKGGGLARACRAGRLISLIISDVLGDPLDVIASGPTVVDTSTPGDALAILEQFGGAPQAALDYLRSARPARERPTCRVTNLVIGNNAKAVDAAGQEAVRRGYSPALTAATTLEGPAEEIGVHLAHMLRQMADGAGPDCLITGGEPTVRLAPPYVRGKGGRNQQLVLAALAEILNLKSEILNLQFCLLSAGTDGEDGPTDAAGAIIDSDLLARLEQSQLDPNDHLRRNDAYPLFEQLGGLIKTGPTHTNVCDVRVVLAARRKQREH